MKEQPVTVVADDLAAMWRVAARAAQRFQEHGGVVALHGDLGAGKTTFVQGLAAALGVTTPITSPTFALVVEHSLPDSRLLVHMDLYRLQGVCDLEALGFDEYLEGDNLVLIEWAERAATLLPPEALSLTIELLPPPAGGRRLLFSAGWLNEAAAP